MNQMLGGWYPPNLPNGRLCLEMQTNCSYELGNLLLRANASSFKSKFCGIPGIFELALDRFPKFITKGLIF